MLAYFVLQLLASPTYFPIVVREQLIYNHKKDSARKPQSEDICFCQGMWPINQSVSVTQQTISAFVTNLLASHVLIDYRWPVDSVDKFLVKPPVTYVLVIR